MDQRDCMVQIPSLILMNFYCSFTKWNMDTYVNLSWFADLKVVIRKHNSRVVSMNDGYVRVVENECKVKDIAKITQPCSSFFCCCENQENYTSTAICVTKLLFEVIWLGNTCQISHVFLELFRRRIGFI